MLIIGCCFNIVVELTGCCIVSWQASFIQTLLAYVPWVLLTAAQGFGGGLFLMEIMVVLVHVGCLAEGRMLDYIL